ncbi:acetyltransferase [Nitrosococcus wardiae]|uniref:Acetyltransferase n=1 Tax=Nitrosococcus wardiae TaxID=1814290 RepID=A0A4P7C0H4_9GAMM|nr:acetyltransferase [Nitrosococcus wardiae]QBQ55079.1 acetyltransferase [Nitrosococcus wardiae]
MNNTKIAETVRLACLEAALNAYEDAGISGLCAEGRWEYAVAAIRELDLETILREVNSDHRDKPNFPK